MVRTLAAAALILASLLMTVMSVYAEGFIDFYVGAAITRDSDQKVTAPGFSDTSPIAWDTSVTAGGRFGFWFESLEWVGLALDASFFRPDKDITVFPVSALAMLRLPLLKDNDKGFPHGRLQPYIAAGPGLFISRADGNVGTFGSVSDTSVDLGVDVRGGLAFLITKNIAAFAEYRFTHVKPEFGFDIAGVKFKTETTLDTHHIVGGVGFRF
jgi:hypothetical protein